jgi:hypothetical protein
MDSCAIQYIAENGIAKSENDHGFAIGTFFSFGDVDYIKDMVKREVRRRQPDVVEKALSHLTALKTKWEKNLGGTESMEKLNGIIAILEEKIAASKGIPK